MVNWLGQEVQSRLEITDTVLDIGCGIMQASNDLICKSVLGVDIWKPYLEHIKYIWPTIHLDVTKNLDYFLDESYDVVICLDLLEHVEFEQAKYILSHLTRICRKKAIIFTPSEFRTNEEATKGCWGLEPCVYQWHRCLLTRTELIQAGFKKFIPNVDNAYLAVFEKSIIGTSPE